MVCMLLAMWDRVRSVGGVWKVGLVMKLDKHVMGKTMEDCRYLLSGQDGQFPEQF